MEDTKRIVEINGIKVEVDLRTAKRVDSFKVGDAVKVLIKNYTTYESRFGMIIGFDEFKTLPTMIVASLVTSSYTSPIAFHYINEKSTDIEICPHDANDIGVQKCDIIDNFKTQINKKQSEIDDLLRQQHYFETMFGKYFK